jgi:hypothetical protein
MATVPAVGIVATGSMGHAVARRVPLIYQPSQPASTSAQPAVSDGLSLPAGV